MLVKFYTLSGKFGVERTQEFATVAEAEAAVIQHANPAGYTNVKAVDDGDGSVRYTARTPGGRGGRNVAAYDLDF